LFYAFPGNYLAVFDYKGFLETTLNYPRETHFLGISDGIAYSHDYHDVLSCFDLTTGLFLDDKKLPTDEPEGIRIYNGNLYYADFYKRVIGMVPLKDLIAAN
jgi:hypothetical protein